MRDRAGSQGTWWGLGVGSKAPVEDLELNRKKMLYPMRLKKRKLAIEIFIN